MDRLSGGEAQRVSLARAFAAAPDVLFLDEPFAALDAPTRETLLDDLGRLLAAAGTTTVLITHDRAEALRLGDRVAVLLEGRLAEVGPPERVFGSPVSEAVARFVGVENLLPGRVLSHGDGLVVVEVGARRVTVAGTAEAGERVLVGLRPEDLTLEAPAPRGATSAQNRLAGHVVRLTPLGPLWRVTPRLRGAAHRAPHASGRRDARARARCPRRGDLQGDRRAPRAARRAPRARDCPGAGARRVGARLDMASGGLLQGG